MKVIHYLVYKVSCEQDTAPDQAKGRKTPSIEQQSIGVL